MLFPLPLSQLNAEHIRQFCQSFPEDLRVEYKQELSESVRNKIPAIVSSFANSFGGILLVGVKTDRGSVVPPVAGYVKPKEELRLTVENICLQNLNPPIVPRIQEVPSDVAGLTFLVVEVDESPLAPHAIENSRKIYVRTGDGNTPYDLADISTIDRLLQRRKQISAEWDVFTKASEMLFKPQFNRMVPKLRTLVGPNYPASEVTDRERLFQFVNQFSYNGGRLNQNAYRDPAGVCGIRVGSDSERSVMRGVTRGQFYFCQELRPHVIHAIVEGREQDIRIYPFAWVAHIMHRSLRFTADFFRSIRYSGEIKIESSLYGVQGASFTVDNNFFESLSSFVSDIPAKVIVDAETMHAGVPALVAALMHQLIWPFISANDTLQEGTIEKLTLAWLAGRT